MLLARYLCLDSFLAPRQWADTSTVAPLALRGTAEPADEAAGTTCSGHTLPAGLPYGADTGVALSLLLSSSFPRELPARCFSCTASAAGGL